ncbi:hypothetical protein ACFCYH_16085 [Streptomyces sp. NPDC056400]|uniref:hypothetical protein n=1 Tax=Streptomyces sp. NPDC056400 TaxID=3345808 RepID=UPI0035E269CE
MIVDPGTVAGRDRVPCPSAERGTDPDDMTLPVGTDTGVSTVRWTARLPRAATCCRLPD